MNARYRIPLLRIPLTDEIAECSKRSTYHVRDTTYTVDVFSSGRLLLREWFPWFAFSTGRRVPEWIAEATVGDVPPVRSGT